MLLSGFGFKRAKTIFTNSRSSALQRPLLVIPPPMDSAGAWTNSVRRSRRGDGFLIAGAMLHIIIIFQQKNRCYKSRCLKGFVDNSMNVCLQISEIRFCHTSSSKRIFWCVRQLLVVAQKLNLMIGKASRVYICNSNIIPGIQKCQICTEKQQWYQHLICLGVVLI